jgi:DNA-binding CsgD family transcriptional regulator
MLNNIYCVISHEGVLERIHEVETPKSLIGRCDDAVIWLPDPHVSREHAILHWTGENASVLDLGSRNGTHVSERLICGEEPLYDGTEIRIGPYVLRVWYGIGSAIRCFVNSEISTCTDLVRRPDMGYQHLQFPDLTPAQRRVYDGFVEGLSEKQVAMRLNISINTVHTHAKAIYRTFAISSRAELIRRWASLQPQNQRQS